MGKVDTIPNSNAKRGRPAQSISDRVLNHVEISPDGCHVWTGALHPPGMRQYNRYDQSSGATRVNPPRPVMKVGGRLTHPVRALLQVPKGRRLMRLSGCTSNWCVNPDHYTYEGKPKRQDPELDLARTYWLEELMNLDEIRDRFGDEIAETLKAEDF